jgi:hypothetical protein
MLLRIRWGFVVLDGGEFDSRIERRVNWIAFPHPMAVEELLNVLILVDVDGTVVSIFDLLAIPKSFISNRSLSRRLMVAISSSFSPAMMRSSTYRAM